MRKIPYMLVIGEKEMETQLVTPRFWDGKNLPPLSVHDFIEKVRKDSGVFWGLDSNQNEKGVVSCLNL